MSKFSGSMSAFVRDKEGVRLNRQMAALGPKHQNVLVAASLNMGSKQTLVAT